MDNPTPFTRLVVALMAAASLLVPVTAHAGTVADDINMVRASHGLPALGPADRVAADLAREIAENGPVQPADLDRAGTHLYERSGDDPGLTCHCEAPDGEGGFADPVRLYALQTGTRTAGFWVWRSDRSARDNLARMVPSNALVLDPRANGIAASSARGLTVLAVTIDSARLLSAPVLLSGSTFVPDGPAPLAALIPPGPPRYWVDAWRGNGWVPLYSEYARGLGRLGSPAGIAGAQFAWMTQRGAILSWGKHFRLRAASGSTEFRTTAMPAADRRRSWRWGRIGYRDRRRFLAAVSDGSPAGRRLSYAIDGLVRVDAQAQGGDSVTNRITIGGRTFYHIAMDYRALRASRAVRDQIVWHEIGHLAAATFSEADQQAFTALFRRSAHWQSCFRFGGGCLPPEEVFADNFAFWVTGNSRVRTAYGTSRLAGRRAFGRLLARDYRPRAAGTAWAP